MRTEKRSINTNGTCLQGYIYATRSQIEDVLGAPTRHGDKVTTEWELQVGNVVATIYDYKEERAPGKEEFYAWHIGGESQQAVLLLQRLLRGLNIRFA